MTSDENYEYRANQYADLSEDGAKCVNCGQCYTVHETKPWMGTIATVCPSGKSFFALPEIDEDL